MFTCEIFIRVENIYYVETVEHLRYSMAGDDGHYSETFQIQSANQNQVFHRRVQ